MQVLVQNKTFQTKSSIAVEAINRGMPRHEHIFLDEMWKAIMVLSALYSNNSPTVWKKQYGGSEN
jgi:hypothetical protein